jgi:hypothetical protein
MTPTHARIWKEGIGVTRRKTRDFQYDVCLSFAGEDRVYVSAVASSLRKIGIRTFYDEYEKIAFWGKDLFEHLSDVYRNAARFCVIFVSKHYAKKLWTTHERKAAQSRAFEENTEYILPARFDRTCIPGLLNTIGYVDLKDVPPSVFARLIFKKVGVPPRKFYLPPHYCPATSRIESIG